jgi:predicted ATPase/DNA-binding CsgD family transcriptional regulator
LHRDATTRPKHNLPIQLTPFVGRQEELAEIRRILSDPACRLLTLLGPGGTGKTRLAIQSASHQLADWQDGVFFVSLDVVDAPQSLVPAIADALGFSLASPDTPREQLFHYLRERQVLLILDNFEHLIEATDVLTDLLRAAPQIKLLVTSREALNLREEWLYPVRGMPYPETLNGPAADVARLQDYTAIRLFAACARRAHADFSLSDEAQDVLRICQLVEGVPLALELAASWTRSLSCAAIASEIQRSLNFLSSRLRNVPERHSSMQAVFDQSWKLLTRQEQSVFQRLSVFRDGFTRPAARRVAGAALETLTALVEKSLLRAAPGDRYHIHELLRQYAEERLAASSPEHQHVYDLHCDYYADFLSERFPDIAGGRQVEALGEMEAELENLRAGWQWAIDRVKVEALKVSAPSLSLFYQFQSRYLEGANAFGRATQMLSQAPGSVENGLARAVLLTEQAWFLIRLGRLEEAEAAAEQSRELYRRLDLPLVPGYATDPLMTLGIVAATRGDYARAVSLAQQARQRSETQEHRLNRQIAYYLLAQMALVEGEYEKAQAHARTAYEITQKVKDRWFRAYCLNELGNVAAALGDYAAAKEHFRASYSLRKEFDDLEGMALALNHLGEVALQQQADEEARQLYEQSRTIYQEINDLGGLATALNGLGRAALVQGDYETAYRYFQDSLRMARQIQFVPLLLSLLVGVGELWLQTERPARGIELLALAHHHPGSERRTRERAQRRLVRSKAEPASRLGISLDEYVKAVERGRDGDLQTVVDRVSRELVGPEKNATAAAPAIDDAISQPDQPLPEPLTPRELEVLELIAQGLTNQQIADQLVLSVGTVKWYTSEIYGKLEVGNRTQAVAHARELGVLS